MRDIFGLVSVAESLAIFPVTVPVSRRDVEAVAVVPVTSAERKVTWPVTARTSPGVGVAVDAAERVTSVVKRATSPGIAQTGISNNS